MTLLIIMYGHYMSSRIMGELQHFGPNDGLTRTFFLRHFISKVMVVKDYWSKALTSPIEKSGIQLEV